MEVLIFTDDSAEVPEFIGQKLKQFLDIPQFAELVPRYVSVGVESELIDINSHIQKFYILSICSVFRPFLRAVNDFAKRLSVSGNDTAELVLVQDLVRTERPYVYNNYENNFFNAFPKFPTVYPGLSTSITSSNEIANSWGEGDCNITLIDAITNNSEFYWNRVKNEVLFHEMFNQGNAVPRLVSIQSLYNARFGRPLYRHPNDEEPPNVEMVPIVRELMAMVEQHTGVTGLNHALIQHYRHGRDNIASHSDKTLDIDLHTPIINLSLGVSRVMRITNKDEKQRIERIPLRHGECVVFGLRTNQFWHHEVAKDVLLPEHPVFGVERISFTFRKIATFVTDGGVVVGQGSPYKTIADIPPPSGVDTAEPAAAAVSTADESQSSLAAVAVTAEGASPPAPPARMDLIHAFGRENKLSGDFNWNDVYGRGFLVR